MRYYNSFVVKVWTDDRKNLLRGYIQHVATEDDVYFLKWDKMVDFLMSHTKWHINQRECENESDFYFQ